MAKNHEQRPGFLARWFRRLRWLRRAAVIGGLAGGAVKVLRGRSGGSGDVGRPSGPGGGPGGSGRPAPIGGPISQRRAASTTPPAGDEDASSAPSGGTRTLVSVPPLVDDDDAVSPDAAEVVPIVPLDEVEAGSNAALDDDAGESAPILALVGDATSDEGERTWVEPLEGGECPPGYPVKANDKSRIYHVPGGRFYNRTVANRCYPTAEAADANGYRPAKA